MPQQPQVPAAYQLAILTIYLVIICFYTSKSIYIFKIRYPQFQLSIYFDMFVAFLSKRKYKLWRCGLVVCGLILSALPLRQHQIGGGSPSTSAFTAFASTTSASDPASTFTLSTSMLPLPCFSLHPFASMLPPQSFLFSLNIPLLNI